MDDTLTTARITVELPPLAQCVSLARVMVTGAARLFPGLDTDKLEGLLVAVSEACTNAIEAHQRAGFEGPVRLRVQPKADAFEVVVEDCGPGFDPADLPARPPSDHPEHLSIERGWGLGLMNALVDDLVFDLRGDGTCVHLIVRTDGID